MHYVDLTLDSSGVSEISERQFYIISIQRRLADHRLSNARTWPEMLDEHQKWWTHYNSEHHFAHRARQDGRHSPSDVLRRVLGRTYPEEVLSRVLYATQFTRHLATYGYVSLVKYNFQVCQVYLK